MPIAHSYIRFSTAKQELGHSLVRQTDLAAHYAEKHGLTLATENYEDLGVSGYRGKNASEGRLRVFRDAVSSGAIKPGSYLLIENMDRLSRDKARHAVKILEELVDAGIVVVTTSNEKVYDKAKLDGDPFVFLECYFEAVRAHEESHRKSDLIAKAWRKKHLDAQAGKLMSKMCPSWLSVDKAKNKWIVDKAKVKVIKRIFKLALDGHGSPTIARMLNDEGVLNIGRNPKWSFGLVHNLLRNRAVIGEYNPSKAEFDPIPGYYPVIVDETVFALVQDTLTKRRWIGGRGGVAVVNLFAGRSVCAKCGSLMRVSQNRRSDSPRNGERTYLRCQSAYDHQGCDAAAFPYSSAEKAILMSLARPLTIDLTHIETGQESLTAIWESERDELNRRMEALLDMVEIANTPVLKKRIAALKDEMDRHEGNRAKAISQKEQAEGAAHARQVVLDLFDFKKPLKQEQRLKLQSALRRMVSKVTFAPDKRDPQVTIELVQPLEGMEPVDMQIAVRPFMRKTGNPRLRKASVAV